MRRAIVSSSVFQTAAIALFLLIANPTATGQGLAPNKFDSGVTDLARQAQQAEEGRDYRSAAEIYEKILRLQPDLPEIQANLGLMYLLLGRYRDAQRQFEASLRQKPDLLVPNLFLGLDLLKLGKPREALPYLLKAQGINASDQNVASGLGQAYAALGEFEKAIQSYRHALEIAPENADARFGLGTTYLDLQESAAEHMARLGRNSLYGQMLLAESFVQQGRAPDSIRIYKRLLASNPDWPGLHTSTGFACIEQAGVSAAKAEFQAEIDSHPGYLLAHLGMARLTLEGEDAPKFMGELEALWKTDPRFVTANVARLWSSASSHAEDMLKRRVQAFVAAEPTLDLRLLLLNAASSSSTSSLPELSRLYPPGSALSATLQTPLPPSARRRGDPQSLFNSGEYGSCEQILSENFSRLDPPSLLLMAQCSYLEGDYLPALRASERILLVDPNNVAALYWKAEAAEKLALDALSGPGLADPNSYRAHFILGQTYRAAQNYKAAEMQYQAAVELSPSDQGARLGLATTYWRELKFDDALTQLRIVLGTRPEDIQANYIMGEILVTRHQYTEARPHLLVATGAEGRTGLYAHALLGKVYAAQGNLRSAVKELETGSAADDDGSLHFQLFRLYEKVGEHDKAKAALQQSEALRKQQEERARRGVDLAY